MCRIDPVETPNNSDFRKRRKNRSCSWSHADLNNYPKSNPVPARGLQGPPCRPIVPDMHPPPRPIEECYWVEPGKLLAGEYPRTKDEATAGEKVRAFEETGIRAFVDLTEEAELLPYAHLLESASHQRFPIRDESVPDSRENVVATLDAIDGHLGAGRTVYVHCWGGVGRTGLIVGCWLARHALSGQNALERLRELFAACPKASHRVSPETPEQEQYVLNWKEPP